MVGQAEGETDVSRTMGGITGIFTLPLKDMYSTAFNSLSLFVIIV
jgi:hypothetical protein